MSGQKGGIGIGSASIVLVFAVLCLTIFAIISFSSAIADRSLAEVEARLVERYYEADTLAELILAELLQVDGYDFPEQIRGVEITQGWDWDLGADTLSFSCKISENIELYVLLAVNWDDTIDILTWRMRSTGDWEEGGNFLELFDFDDMNLWPGN
jgi:hypothetical protein